MKHKIKACNAATVRQWFDQRGGILVWGCVDLADPTRQWTTPRLDASGNPVGKPHWAATGEPILTISDPSEVNVIVPREVKRFRVSIRPCRGGMAFKCTDASSDRIRRTIGRIVAEAEKRTGSSPEVWHEFDYDTQEAVIFVADRREVPLPQYSEDEHARRSN